MLSFEEEDFYSESTEELFEIDEEEPDLLDSLLDKAFDGKNDEDSAIGTMKEENPISYEEEEDENQEISAEDEEKLVDLDLIPNFSTDRNVYGTSFNVYNGELERPRNIHVYTRNSIWFKFPIAKCLRKRKSRLEKRVEKFEVKYGTQIDVKMSNVKIVTKTANDVEVMETRNIQNFIVDCFRDGKLGVLLIGVENNKITGCPMGISDQDNLRLALDTVCQTEFEPRIENVLDTIDIRFYRVLKEHDDVADDDVVENRHLVVIWLKKLRRNIYSLASEKLY